MRGKTKEIVGDIKKIARHWGLGEIESSIYAVIVTSETLLTAREIAQKIGYAYSSTINGLNNLIRSGFSEKRREKRKNVYNPLIDFVEIIKKETDDIHSLLKQVAGGIHALEDTYKRKLAEVLKRIEIAIGYLEKTKIEADSGV